MILKTIKYPRHYYNDKIANDSSNKQQVLEFLKSEVATIKQKFVDKSLSFDQASNELEAISKTNLLTNVVEISDYITTLNESRLAFTKGEEYVKNNDIGNALKSYKGVIKDDSNYSLARNRISDLTLSYKAQALKSAIDSANNKDYQKAVDTLTTASEILDKDNEIEAKKAVYSTQLTSKLQSQQQVSILSANVVIQSSDYKTLYPDMLQSIIKNNSTKTIKDVIIGWVGYDSNNYPLKIKTQFGGNDADYEFDGNAQDINVLAGKTFGDKNGWNLDENHGLSKVLACVKNVTYYDGTTWDNSYYQYWLNQYKDKPFK